MNQYRKFIFEGYKFDTASGQLELNYAYDSTLRFQELYKFDFDFAEYDDKTLDRALQLLFFMAGVSYYKMYLAPEIAVRMGQIDKTLVNFLDKTYQRGLSEFFYVNQLDVNTAIKFPVNSEVLTAQSLRDSKGQLIGLGGGKDSLVSVELLRDQARVATWSLNHRSQLEPLVSSVGLPHFWVERQWDPQIQVHNQQGALNGHVPISAIFATVGTIVAILSGYQDVIVSNESSASEPTLTYQGVEINHQYSKSLEFERDFQNVIKQIFSDSLRYYSLPRPFSELRIAELFSRLGFSKYKATFSSCNRAYTHGQQQMFWCGECAKCAFVFLILTPFIERSVLESLWHGKNLLLDNELQSTYKQLLGIEGDKPLDCVGEVKEARAAMRLAQEKYPELQIYTFDIPDDYNFRAWSEHSMPADVFAMLQSKIT